MKKINNSFPPDDMTKGIEILICKKCGNRFKVQKQIFTFLNKFISRKCPVCGSDDVHPDRFRNSH
ncbi:hypothetical protein FACS1894190_01200 [Spirochaetia bacterium]|nr:hypothetical protein FACS1894190_01200 [Spirochaetia bacterium]